MEDPTGIAELQQAEAAFRRVFAKASYTDPFGASVRSRLLLYPIAYTILKPEQYAALSAAGGASCKRAYFAGFGGEERGWGGTYAHRLVDLSSYDEYAGANPAGTLEHFLYGIGGDWGAVTSDGEYALLGGDEAFVASFANTLGYDQDLAINSLSPTGGRLSRPAPPSGGSRFCSITSSDRARGDEHGSRFIEHNRAMGRARILPGVASAPVASALLLLGASRPCSLPHRRGDQPAIGASSWSSGRAGTTV